MNAPDDQDVPKVGDSELPSDGVAVDLGVAAPTAQEELAYLHGQGWTEAGPPEVS